MKQATFVGVVGLALLLAVPAAASCQRWGRLSPAGKADAVAGHIQSVVYGNTAKQYVIPKAEIERCAMDQVDQIVLAIDGACSDGRTADKQAPRRTVEGYIRTCVSRRPR